MLPLTNTPNGLLIRGIGPKELSWELSEIVTKSTRLWRHSGNVLSQALPGQGWEWYLANGKMMCSSVVGGGSIWWVSSPVKLLCVFFSGVEA